MNTTASKPWTVMVYFAGDNNLTTEMARALEEMIQSAPPANLNLYVYFDSLSRDVPTLYCDLSARHGQRVQFFRSHKIRPKLIERERLFNENSASMNNIVNFVHWCVQRDLNQPNPPDREYALIFSGHSFGFLDWGLFKDTNSDYYMTLSKLRWLFERITYPRERLESIAEAQQEEEREYAAQNSIPYRPWSASKLKERTTPVIGKPVALLGFDSCEMGTLEIASQFKGLTKTLVASAGSVPNAGWNYAEILTKTIAEKASFIGDSPQKLAVLFVERFIKQQSTFALADKSVDLAAWDITQLSKLELAFASLCDDLIACFVGGGYIAHHQMRRLLSHVHFHCQTYLLEQHIDLGDFCKLLIREIDLLEHELPHSKTAELRAVRESCKRVLRRMNRCILLCGFSGKDRQYTNGVALFFPWSLESYWEARKDYEKLSFIKSRRTGRKWKVFLKLYLKRISRRPAVELSPVDENGKVIIVEGMPTVVYRSYAFSDRAVFGYPSTTAAASATGVWSAGRRPPDGDKRPPDGDKRPPDGDKLLNNISLFLSYFMRMKNIRARWNQTGFSANTNAVEFVEDSSTPALPGAKIPVKIPGSRRIESI